MSSELAQIYDIGELVDVTQGLAINSKTKHLLRDEGLPLLRITDLFSGSYSQFVTQEGVPKQCIANSEELIYTRTGQVGFVFTNKVGVVHNNCFKVTPKDDRLSRRYLYWYLRQESVRSYVNTVASGSVQKDLNHSAFKTLKIPLLDLEAQRQIDSILSSLDDRITLLRETNATLEAIAQALFKSWFVDFDPVHAKMEGRTPEGMDEATAALFPDGFETSELGEVPRGWRIGELGDVAALKGGKQLSKEAFSNSAPNPVFGGAGVMGHTEQRNATDFVITVGRVGAYCGQFFWHIGDAWVNNNASHVLPSGKISSEWLLLWLKSVNMDVIKKGAAQPFVSNGDIAKLSMIHPPIELIDAFGALVAPMFARSQLLVQQSVELASVRDTLLPRLISGQLRLSEAQAATEAALGGTLSV